MTPCQAVPGRSTTCAAPVPAQVAQPGNGGLTSPDGSARPCPRAALCQPVPAVPGWSR